MKPQTQDENYIQNKTDWKQHEKVLLLLLSFFFENLISAAVTIHKAQQQQYTKDRNCMALLGYGKEWTYNIDKGDSETFLFIFHTEIMGIVFNFL